MVQLTEYLLPNGRKRSITLDISADHEEMAQEIIESGARFEIEVLATREISVTIFDAEEETDVAIRVCNMSDLISNLEEMIEEYHSIL